MDNILQYKEYFASISFSREDDVLYGKIIGINDLVSFEGASVQELKTAFEEAVEDYLETCKELNKEPDKTYKGSFNIRLTPDLHRKAALCAAFHNVSLNDFVRQSIEIAISNEKLPVSNNDKGIPVGSGDTPWVVVPPGSKADPFYVTCDNKKEQIILQSSLT